MPDPFTIHIFVPDGDPEGVRLIGRMNWTGIGLAFPRSLSGIRSLQPRINNLQTSYGS